MPPVQVHKEYGSGWAMVGDLLLCLPLSVFVQIIRINYKVSARSVLLLKEYNGLLTFCWTKEDSRKRLLAVHSLNCQYIRYKRACNAI